MTGKELPKFKFWCQKVLPLVYDDSLSYYETLCKVVKYLNNLTEDEKKLVEGFEELKAELAIVQEWINNFSADYAEEVIKDCLATMIFVGLTTDGYIVFYIPESWEDIEFNTTGLDIYVPNIDFGHLTLSY